MFAKKLMLVAALALAGCANYSVAPPEATAPPVASSSCGLAAGTVIDEKALYAAEAAYNVPAQAYVTLDANGQLSAAVKAQVRPILVDAYGALKVARDAYAIGNTCNFFEAVNKATSLANQAKAFLPK